jgi:hypothetical protein
VERGEKFRGTFKHGVMAGFGYYTWPSGATFGNLLINEDVAEMMLLMDHCK